ncbi:hypothetical protein MRB53_034907 [Persea americana]|uniref:Uncharacterized protein n=1 Tax=Persea americana TaxID=3435 RepID=A0ACC2K379_PERAE|nr:hypothetical protein MRB53_034907 [Persea americana]
MPGFFSDLVSIDHPGHTDRIGSRIIRIDLLTEVEPEIEDKLPSCPRRRRIATGHHAAPSPDSMKKATGLLVFRFWAQKP